MQTMLMMMLFVAAVAVDDVSKVYETAESHERQLCSRRRTHHPRACTSPVPTPRSSSDQVGVRARYHYRQSSCALHETRQVCLRRHAGGWGR